LFRPNRELSGSSGLRLIYDASFLLELAQHDHGRDGSIEVLGANLAIVRVGEELRLHLAVWKHDRENAVQTVARALEDPRDDEVAAERSAVGLEDRRHPRAVAAVASVVGHLEPDEDHVAAVLSGHASSLR